MNIHEMTYLDGSIDLGWVRNDCVKVDRVQRRLVIHCYRVKYEITERVRTRVHERISG